jgi:ribose 5-phosphate isomerase B
LRGRRGHSTLSQIPKIKTRERVWRQNENRDWPLVASHVAEAVARGEADEGIVCCWTGTGASIAANKVPGIRAALVHDAETARGARIWNHANVLALSLRATSIPVACEILDVWFTTSTREGEAHSEWNQQQIERIRQLEDKYRTANDERRVTGVR